MTYRMQPYLSLALGLFLTAFAFFHNTKKGKDTPQKFATASKVNHQHTHHPTSSGVQTVQPSWVLLLTGLPEFLGFFPQYTPIFTNQKAHRRELPQPHKENTSISQIQLITLAQANNRRNPDPQIPQNYLGIASVTSQNV